MTPAQQNAAAPRIARLRVLVDGLDQANQSGADDLARAYCGEISKEASYVFDTLVSSQPEQLGHMQDRRTISGV